MNKYYALHKNNETEEYHIQEYKQIINSLTGEKIYKPVSKYCNCSQFRDSSYTSALRMKYTDGKLYTYYGEAAMRFLCAKVGRMVCGQCVATLYTTK